MTSARRRQINRLADLVRTCCDADVPVDVERVVRQLGGSVESVTDADFEARIEKVDDGFRITLGSPVAENRRRFSIAHELGHLFLHMGYIIDPDEWASIEAYMDSVYFRYGFGAEEYDANEFAGALLMPAEAFEQVAEANREGRRYAIGPIADHFRVSVEAAATRGRWLGFFAWEAGDE